MVERIAVFGCLGYQEITLGLPSSVRLQFVRCFSSQALLSHSLTSHPFRYYVNRDTLFSYHKASETFLQRMMSLYVSSHYKNSPNDLQLMSDAPAHHLFVLLGPVSNANSMPDILAVVQVCLEGDISKESVLKALSRGERANGDLIPWSATANHTNAMRRGFRARIG